MTPPPVKHAHAEPAAAVVMALDSRAGVGLSVGEAAVRGGAGSVPTRWPPPPRASVGAVLLAQLRSVIVGLLAAAVVVSLITGDLLQAAAIAVVLAINAALGTFTELRARRAIEGLLQLDVPHAVVLRDGAVRDIDARDLVPGDVIDLTAGAQVPADARLIAGRRPADRRGPADR